MNLSQRRLIGIFKNFVEKIFVPQFHKMDSHCQQQWGKFASMVSIEQVNFGQLQLFVDTLPTITPTNGSNFQRRNKSPLFNKNRKQSSNDQQNNSIGFNPSKTFGGARSKAPMFPLASEFEETQKKQFNLNKDFSRQAKQEKTQKQQPFTTQGIMPALQRLYKSFMENHQKIQKIQLTNNVQLNTVYQGKNYYI